MRIILLGLLLAGCTTVEQIPGPDGETHLAISCKRSISNCYAEAAESCPNGYSMVDKTDESGLFTTQSNVMVAHKYTMLVKCK